MLPYLAPENNSDGNEYPGLSDDGLRFFINGKMVSAKEAEAASNLSSEDGEIWKKNRQIRSEIRKLEEGIIGPVRELVERIQKKGRTNNIEILIISRGWDLLDFGTETVEIYPQGTDFEYINIGSDWGKIDLNLIKSFSEDPNKLWESATPEQFRENGKKYNQISLMDDGRFFLTMIKPGAVESIPLSVPTDKVDAIRAYVKSKDNKLEWDKTGEGYTHGYSGPGGEYQFDRRIILLDSEEETIYLLWKGNHREPLIERGPFSIDDTAEIQIVQK